MKYTFENIKQEKKLKLCVITLSDRAFKGIYEDTSGIEIKTRLENYFSEKGWNYEISYEIIPDEKKRLTKKLLEAGNQKTDIIFTTGSTGIGERDIVPEVVKPLLDKEIPGIMELIRVKYGLKIPNAVLSRGVAGIVGQAQIYTLPGSLKAVKDYMNEILKTLEHLIYMYYSIDTHKRN